MENEKLPELKFYELNEIQESLLTRVVIVSRYNEKWIYCKAKDRDTWELPGGKIEEGELPLDAARRELFEETGAMKAKIEPICIYSFFKPALLCYATIIELGRNPEFEIKKIDFFENEPKYLTYPEIHPKLLNKVIEELEKNSKMELNI